MWKSREEPSPKRRGLLLLEHKGSSQEERTRAYEHTLGRGRIVGLGQRRRIKGTEDKRRTIASFLRDRKRPSWKGNPDLGVFVRFIAKELEGAQFWCRIS